MFEDLNVGTLLVTVIGFAIVGFGIWRAIASRGPKRKSKDNVDLPSGAVTCAGCNKDVAPDAGYAIYVGATEGTRSDNRIFLSTSSSGRAAELGTLLYCEQCGDSLFTEEMWQQAKPVEIEMDVADLETLEGRNARSEVISSSVVLRAKRLGFGVSQARAESRELTKEWWRDKRDTYRAAFIGLTQSFLAVLLYVALLVGPAIVLKRFFDVEISTGAAVGVGLVFLLRMIVKAEEKRRTLARPDMTSANKPTVPPELPIRNVPSAPEYANSEVRILADSGIDILLSRDLSSGVIAHLSKGELLRLGSSTEIDGREWFEAETGTKVRGYALGPSIRSRCEREKAAPAN